MLSLLPLVPRVGLRPCGHLLGLADVCFTGRNVIIEQSYGGPKITKGASLFSITPCTLLLPTSGGRLGLPRHESDIWRDAVMSLVIIQ